MTAVGFVNIYFALKYVHRRWQSVLWCCSCCTLCCCCYTPALWSLQTLCRFECGSAAAAAPTPHFFTHLVYCFLIKPARTRRSRYSVTGQHEKSKQGSEAPAVGAIIISSHKYSVRDQRQPDDDVAAVNWRISVGRKVVAQSRPEELLQGIDIGPILGMMQHSRGKRSGMTSQQRCSWHMQQPHLPGKNGKFQPLSSFATVTGLKSCELQI